MIYIGCPNKTNKTRFCLIENSVCKRHLIGCDTGHRLFVWVCSEYERRSEGFWSMVLIFDHIKWRKYSNLHVFIVIFIFASFCFSNKMSILTWSFYFRKYYKIFNCNKVALVVFDMFSLSFANFADAIYTDAKIGLLHSCAKNIVGYNRCIAWKLIWSISSSMPSLKFRVIKTYKK